MSSSISKLKFIRVAVPILLTIMASFSAQADIQSGLEAYYPFNGSANDSTANHHDPTLVQATLTSDRFDNADSAYDFDGDSDKIVIPSGVDILGANPDEWTISAWFRLDAYNSETSCIISDYSGGVSDEKFGVFLVVDNGDHPLFSIIRYLGGTGDPTLTSVLRSQVLVPLSSWHMATLVVSKIQGKMKIYYDGEFDSEVDLRSDLDYFEDNQELMIGNRNLGGDYGGFDGQIDDLRIYSRSLSDADVGELYLNDNIVTALHVPSMYPTIASALEACDPGDTVFVDPGTYPESRLDLVDGAVLMSVSETEMPVIAAQDSIAVSCVSCSSGVVMKGFMIEAADIDNSYCLVAELSTLTLDDCGLAQNDSTVESNGILSDDCSLEVASCELSGFRGRWGCVIDAIDGELFLFTTVVVNNDVKDGAFGLVHTNSTNVNIVDSGFLSNNDESPRSGVLGIFRGSALLDNCSFSDNAAGGSGVVELRHLNGAVLRDCTFSSNIADYQAAGVSLSDCFDASFINCSFSNNHVVLPDSLYVSGGAVHVVDSGASFQRCTFTDNSASSLAHSFGGAIQSYASELSLYDCEFSNCVAVYGGAIEAEHSTLDIQLSRFHGNTSTGWGGAVRLYDTDAVFNVCDFDTNSAEFGGGAIQSYNSVLSASKMQFQDGDTKTPLSACFPMVDQAKAMADSTMGFSLILDNCNARWNNSQGSNGGAIRTDGYSVHMDGGAFVGNYSEPGSYSSGGFAWLSYSTLTLQRALVNENSAEDYGAAIGLYYCDSDTNIISDCTITGNIGGNLGVIYLHNSIAAVSDSEISGNDATGICARYSAIDIARTDITGTQSSYAALRFEDCISGSVKMEDCVIADTPHQAVSVHGSDIELARCTIAGNAGHGVDLEDGSKVTARGVIVCDNIGQAFNGSTSDSLTLACSDLYGNVGDYTGLAYGLVGTNGNISLSPEFCDRVEGDYSLAEYSPCAPANSGGCDQIGARGVGCAMSPPHVLRIQPDGLGDVSTIQDAVFALTSGDTVLLADGVFAGEGNRGVEIVGKTIHVLSDSGDPDACVIDCERLGRAFDFDGAGHNLYISGVSIVNGLAADGGGAVKAAEGGLYINDCRIDSNEVSTEIGGAAIYSTSGTVRLDKCQVVRNVSPGSTGGDIVFAANGSLEIDQCTIASNESPNSAIYGSPIASLARSIIAYHAGNAISGEVSGTITCVDIYGNGKDWGSRYDLIGIDGNMSIIPRFCDPLAGDFTLAENSPCTAADSGVCGAIGALPIACGSLGNRIFVEADGSGDFPTIADAVLAASDGDTVILGNGVFRGSGNVDVSLVDKRLAFVSASGDPDSCRIDCEQAGRFLILDSGGSSTVLVSGIEISNGTGDSGGAIRLDSGFLSIANCSLSGNYAVLNGGAVWVASGYTVLSISDCDFRSNSSGSRAGAIFAADFPGGVYIRGTGFDGNTSVAGGGAVYLRGTTEGRLELSNCSFRGNSITSGVGGRGGALSLDINSDINECLFYENSCTSGSYTTGSIIRLYYKNATIANCTFVDNDLDGVVVNDGEYYPAAINIENTIIANNGAALGANFHHENDVSIICTDIYGNEGGNWVLNIAEFASQDGNLEEDPLFCSDYTLASNSPCAPGNGACGLIGAFDVGCGEGGRDYIIKPDGSGDFATIQDAIDVAPSGTLIRLESGTYAGPGNGSFSFLGKEIEISSASGNPNECVIDMGSAPGGIVFSGGETANSVLARVTLADGTHPILTSRNGSPVLRGCIIRDSAAPDSTLIDIDSGTLAFEECTIDGNDAGLGYLFSTRNGGGVVFQQTAITRNVCADVLHDDGSGTVEASCTNLWSNGGGDWNGAMAVAYDREYCISKDPDYCGSDLSVSDYSHHLPYEGTWRCNGFIGAVGVGCTVVPDSLHVSANGAGMYPTIAAAIAAAEDGDVVVLEDGVYRGEGNRNIDLSGKLVTVMSRSDMPDSCIIDCEGSDADQNRAFLAISGETRKTVIRGISIRNGYRATYPDDSLMITNVGAALFCWNSYPLIQNCAFENNTYAGYGAVYYSLQGTELLLPAESAAGEFDIPMETTMAADAGLKSDPVADNMLLQVENCWFRNGTCTLDHGARGLHLYGDVDWKVINCTFSEYTANPSGGAVATVGTSGGGFGSHMLQDCVFYGNNYGNSLVYCPVPVQFHVRNNIFARNSLNDDGAILIFGMVRVTTNYPNETYFENNIVYENSYMDPIFLSQGIATNGCNVFYGNANGDFIGSFEGLDGVNGNLVADPLFCDPNNGVFTVDASSPCVQHPDGCSLVGPFGAGCGATGIVDRLPGPLAWSEIRFEAAPNPFNPRVVFRMKGLEPGRSVKLVIYDLRGYRVFEQRDVADEYGTYEVCWNGQDHRGRAMEAGAYICRVSSSGKTKLKKILLLK